MKINIRLPNGVNKICMSSDFINGCREIEVSL